MENHPFGGEPPGRTFTPASGVTSSVQSDLAQQLANLQEYVRTAMHTSQEQQAEMRRQQETLARTQAEVVSFLHRFNSAGSTT
jgi:hypothetical protein